MPLTDNGLDFALSSFFVIQGISPFLSRGLYVHFYNSEIFDVSSRVLVPRFGDSSTTPQFLKFNFSNSFDITLQGNNYAYVKNNEDLQYQIDNSISFRYISLQRTSSLIDYDSLWSIDLESNIFMIEGSTFAIPVNSIELRFGAK
jgi:hypothetical protein